MEISSRKKILLVRPPAPKDSISLTELILTEPLELEQLWNLCKEKYRVEILDLMIESKDYFFYKLQDFNPEIVAFTSYINQIEEVKNLAENVKSYNSEIKVVVGGVHAAVVPEDFSFASVNAVFYKNQVNSFLDYLEGKEENLLYDSSGKIISHSRKDPFLQAYIRPLWKKYKHRYHYLHYREIAILKTSLGCQYACNFCFCHHISPYRTLPLDRVVKELKSLEAENIFIVDDNFLGSPERVEGFISLLEEENIQKKYIVYGRADFIARFPGILEKFKNVGLEGVIVGLESFSPEEITSYHKKLKAEENEKAIAVLQTLGIEIYALFMSHLKWKGEDFSHFRKKVKELGLKNVTLSVLTPFRGTELYEQWKDKIRDFSPHRWDFLHLQLHPFYLSKEKYYRELFWTLLYLNSDFTTLRKILKFHPGLIISIGKIMWQFFKVWLEEGVLDGKSLGFLV